MNSGKSFIRLNVKVTGLDPTIKSIMKMRSIAEKKEIIEGGARNALIVIKEYYRMKGQPFWVNPALPTHGAGRQKSQWWRNTETEWKIRSVTGKGAVIENDTVGLSHKVTGGTITAKRKKFLTIPIDPRAHNIKAKDFSRTVSPLFLVKNILAIKDANEPSGIKGIYVLKKSVTQAPWPGALPPEQGYVDAFMAGIVDSIMEQMK